MDLGTLSGIATAVMLAAFLAVVAWAWSGKRRADFEAAARLPLGDDDSEQTP